MSPRESAGGIVIGPGGRLALVEQHGNSWSFPKGGVEAGESERDAAVREVAEETGLRELEWLADLGTYERYSIARDGKSELQEQGLRPRTFFLFKTPQADFHEHDPHGEITRVRWVTVDEALALLTHPKDREFLASIRSKIEEETLQ